ncbi:hypothetical protein FOZ62_026558, partial [Perkinsus olseni]
AILVAPSGRLTRLTQDHRPTTNAAETDRVVNNGGVVLFGRVGGQLAVSRALGDWCLKNDGVISEPSVSVKREVVQGSIVVAASDGVWDVLGDEEVATFVSMHINEEDVAEKLALKHHILECSITAWSRAWSYYGRDIGGRVASSTNRAHHSSIRDMVFPPQGDISFDQHAGLYDVSRSSEDEESLRQLPPPSSRLGINTTTAIPIQNDNFIGELVVIHRPADEGGGEFPYSKFMSTCPRVRCELRWQGRFLEPPGENVYFGIEGYSPTPKLGFMANITARILMSISTRLAAARGSRLISNFPNTSQQGERTYFLFPLTSADTVIEHSSGGGSGDCDAVDIPDITSDRGIYGKVSSNHKFDTGHIYTFCYWSMFVDFVTWDLRNLPAISGTSLCTLLGPQPIHIVMRDDKGTCFMNILSAHKSFSQTWAHHLRRPRAPNHTLWVPFNATYSPMPVVPEHVSGGRRVVSIRRVLMSQQSPESQPTEPAPPAAAAPHPIEGGGSGVTSPGTPPQQVMGPNHSRPDFPKGDPSFAPYAAMYDLMSTKRDAEPSELPPEQSRIPIDATESFPINSDAFEGKI